ncbi:DUF6303 family protein [Streptomyces sp. 147326]|uniref:DUF6303 family protein n=1 Tax=Streptomyces sp. 147326 TaxID=3074379 RepID=UPI003857452D
MTQSARLANSYFGEWEIYIVTADPADDWPTHCFGRTSPIPTLAERTAALTGLGYEAADGAAWEWMELPNGDMDTVELLASFDVRLVGEAP